MKRMKRLLSVLLIFTLCMVMMPQTAMAASANETVTVYLTVSNDGEFVTGTDGTVMARVPITVSYYDLADYGLEAYYRYEAASYEDGGEYINTNIVKQPTLLHLYIKALEDYYAGHKLSKSDVHSNILDVTGTPTSLYMKHFWGHDENLMYFVNHEYPEQRHGWGSTCDYILLNDGDEIDVGMFTDWNFYKTGAFTTFDYTSKRVKPGEAVTLTMQASATVPNAEGDTAFVGVPMPYEAVRVSSDKGQTWARNYAETDANGQVTLTFQNPGTYYVAGGPSFVNYPDATPPISVITVVGESTGKDDGKLDNTGKDNTGKDNPSKGDQGKDDNKKDDQQSGTTGSTGKTGSASTDSSGKIVDRSADFSQSAAVPANVSTKLSGYNRVTCSWDAVKDAVRYRVYFRENSSKEWSWQETESTALTIRDFTPGSQAEFRVAAVFSAKGKETFSQTSDGSLAQCIKAPLPRVSKVKKNSMTLSWSKVAGADGYKIRYKAGKGKWKTRYTAKTTWKRSKLKAGTSYQYRVYAYQNVDGKKVLSGYAKTAKAKTKK